MYWLRCSVGVCMRNGRPGRMGTCECARPVASGTRGPSRGGRGRIRRQRSSPGPEGSGRRHVPKTPAPHFAGGRGVRGLSGKARVCSDIKCPQLVPDTGQRRAGQSSISHAALSHARTPPPAFRSSPPPAHAHPLAAAPRGAGAAQGDSCNGKSGPRTRPELGGACGVAGRCRLHCIAAAGSADENTQTLRQIKARRPHLLN